MSYIIPFTTLRGLPDAQVEAIRSAPMEGGETGVFEVIGTTVFTGHILKANAILFRPNSTLVLDAWTNSPLIVVARKLLFQNVNQLHLIRFPNGLKPAPGHPGPDGQRGLDGEYRGADGGNGTPGGPAAHGGNCSIAKMPTIYIGCHEIAGSGDNTRDEPPLFTWLNLMFRGQDGGDGGPGGRGGGGGNGVKGDDAVDNGVWCAFPGGDGGRGGNGGRGGRGGNGTPAAHGSDVIYFATTRTVLNSLALSRLDNRGGAGGASGAAGIPGAPGQGAPGGNGSLHCKGGHGGGDGGSTGSEGPGLPGKDGQSGSISLIEHDVLSLFV